MSRQSARWTLYSTLLLAAVTLGQPTVANPQPIVDSAALGRPILASSDLLAAFLVAYDAQHEAWKAKGVQLTPRELIARHYSVQISREGSEQVVVSFAPSSPSVSGGGVTYHVDTRTLKVVGKSFER